MMFFRKKHDEKCARCGGALVNDFSYCPYCGLNLVNKEKISKDYGLLGKNDAVDEDMTQDLGGFNLGIADKIFNSVFNNLVKNLDKQVAREIQNAEITPMQNGFRIVIGPQPRKKQHPHKTTAKNITEEQMQRISSFPKKEVKSSVRRLGDKVVCELAMPGVSSTDDIFISKLESGYEIKALGKKNMFINRLNVNLPIRGIGLEEKKVVVEFSQKE